MADVETDDGAIQRPKRATRMSAKRKAVVENTDKDAKKRRTFGDFFTFCSFVLEYEERLATAEYLKLPAKPDVNSDGGSSVSSSPSSTESSSGESEGENNMASSGSESSSTDEDESSNDKLEYTSDDDSWNLVTCFCRRPFAGRPMIECSKCETWIHLYCAKIKKENVPDTYLCPKCSRSRD